MFRDLLVHVDGSEPGRRRVQFAVDLAARMGARLSGFHVTPPADASPRFNLRRIAEVTAEISSNLALDARAAAKIFNEEVAGNLTDVLWLEGSGDVVKGISAQARYADLVVLGQYECQGWPEAHPLPIAHSVALRCGRPVLVVPGTAKQCALDRVVIAWDGSREAVRAVHDALPLLSQSRSVQVVTVLGLSATDNEGDAQSLLSHFVRHGIAVEKEVLQIRASAEHDSLRKQIEQGHFDLVVMGGYSHPMWLEFIFGGATQSILLSSKIPVLVSH